MVIGSAIEVSGAGFAAFSPEILAFENLPNTAFRLPVMTTSAATEAHNEPFAAPSAIYGVLRGPKREPTFINVTDAD